MSFYQQSIYLLLSSTIFLKFSRKHIYRSVCQLKRIKKGSIINIFLLYHLFIKKYMSILYSYKRNISDAFRLNIILAFTSTFNYINYYISKNIYRDLQKL